MSSTNSFPTAEIRLTFVNLCEGFQSLSERKAFLEGHLEISSEKSLTIIEDFIMECRGQWLKGESLAKWRLLPKSAQGHFSKGTRYRVSENIELPSQDIVAAMNTVFRASSSPEELFRVSPTLRKDREGTVQALNYMASKYEDNPQMMQLMAALKSYLKI